MKDYLSGIISILASFQLLFVALFLMLHKMDVCNFSFWWTDLGGQFSKKSLAVTGMDIHFIFWLIVLILCVISFVFVMRKMARQT